MIHMIQGQIQDIKSDYIVLENSGIGYKIRVPNPFEFEIHSIITMYTHLVVREDSMDLFGFASADTRDFFLKLISVKGLGPKGALAILGSDKVDKVMEAIRNGDSKYLQRFPGIGPKASQQIVLDLYGKIDLQNQRNQVHPKVKQACDALAAMGYHAAEIKKILPELDSNTQLTTGEMIKVALKRLL